MGDVKALPGYEAHAEREPNEHLVLRLREILAEAESGHLRSFVGVGMCVDEWSTHIRSGDVDFCSTSLIGHLSKQLHRLIRDTSN